MGVRTVPRLTKSEPKLRKHATGQWVVTFNAIDCYLGAGKRAAGKRYKQLVEQWTASGRSREFDPRKEAASPVTSTKALPQPKPTAGLSITEVLNLYFRYAMK